MWCRMYEMSFLKTNVRSLSISLDILKHQLEVPVAVTKYHLNITNVKPHPHKEASLWDLCLINFFSAVL